jgi:hypothetical protein
MRALLVHVLPHRRTLVVAAVLGLLGAAAGLAQPLAAREVIEALAADESLTEPLAILSALVAAAAQRQPHVASRPGVDVVHRIGHLTSTAASPARRG